MIDTTMAVLAYWQQGLWRNPLNDLPLQGFIQTPGLELHSSPEIASGILSSSFSSSKSRVWIAPFWFEKTQGDAISTWIPLWLPAKIEAGRLELCDEVVLPWVPTSQFDALREWSPFSEPVHVLDDILSHEYLTEEKKLTYQNWQDFYQAAIALLNQLSDSQWQTRLENAGYILKNNALILERACEAIEPTTLLTQYATLEDFEPRPVEGADALQCLLALEPGEFLAIKAPVSADKEKFIENFIRAKIKTLPALYLLTPHQSPLIHAKITVEGMEEGALKSIVNPEIHSLQIQDEVAEKELEGLLQAQKEFREKIKNRSLWAKLFEIVGNKKFRLEREATEKHLSDQIRQVKVKRTKLHRQLVLDLEIAATRKAPPAPLNPQNWELLKFTVNEKIGCWEKTDKLEEAAFLWIDEANQLLPQQVMPFLANAQRVVFLGDNQDVVPKPLMSALSEAHELALHHFTEEENIEQFHYKGMLPSSGNAFTVALANNTFQTLTEYGIWTSTLALAASSISLPHFLVPVKGKSEEKEMGLCNPIEAQEIITWLSTGPLQNNLEKVAIITPFYAQKNLLTALLEAAKIPCAVFTFDALSYTTWDHIIFSPVFIHGDRRPFIFDQGDHYFYSMRARARKGFWIIGDSAIFDPKMHSPSGNVAKIVFAKEPELIG